MDRKKLTILLLALLVLSVGGNVYQYVVNSDKLSKKEVELLQTEEKRKELKSELDTLLVNYQEMETDNEMYQDSLVHKQEEIKELMEEIEENKKLTAYQVAQYKKEIGTLKRIMKHYIHTIDSLNTANQELQAEVTETRTQYREVRHQKEELEKKADELNEKVEVASVLMAKNVSAVPLDKDDDETDKVRKVRKVGICFVLRENPIVKPGSRQVFIRVAGPSGVVFTNSSENLFKLGGKTLVFTDKKTINYKNQDLNDCIYWKAEGELYEGTYTVGIYADGHKIGEASFVLD